MPTFLFQKLIRDKILDLHIEEGHDIKYTFLRGEELLAALRKKLHEEADEIPIRAKVDDEIIEEIADVRQILADMQEQYGVSDEVIEEVRQRKFDKKGGFVKGIYIESVTLGEDDEWTEYYRAAPDKYPEVDS